MYNWELLNSLDNSIVNEVRQKWVALLADSTQKERAYHGFLATYPAFFFSDTVDYNGPIF